jgi:hypothetical protein
MSPEYENSRHGLVFVGKHCNLDDKIAAADSRSERLVHRPVGQLGEGST